VHACWPGLGECLLSPGTEPLYWAARLDYGDELQSFHELGGIDVDALDYNPRLTRAAVFARINAISMSQQQGN